MFFSHLCRNFFNLYSLLKLKGLIAVSLFTLLPHSASAKPLPEFNVTFEVHAFDIMFGISKQALTCQDQNCTLTATATPSGLASLFVSESTYEEITFLNNSDNLKWLSYLKQSGEDLSDLENVKTVSMIRSEKDSHIRYPERDKQWPNQENIYDIVSIAYALQYRKLNQLALNDIYLQDTSGQEKLNISQPKSRSEVELADLETSLISEQYEFATSKAKVKIWLLPTYHYFPGRVDVYNIQKDKTITLLLQEPPKIR